MMCQVYLHGHLKTAFGPMFKLEVATAGEVFRAFYANFGSPFITHLREGAYRLVRGKRSKGFDIELERINDFRIGGEFHVIPVAQGAKGKGGGIIKAVLGVAIIGAAIFFSGGTLAAPLAGLGTTIGTTGITWGAIATIGVGLALSGASQILAPKEQPKTEVQKTDSFTFNGPVNSNEQGNVIPVIIGEVIVGSQPISAGFTAEDVSLYAQSGAIP